MKEIGCSVTALLVKWSDVWLVIGCYCFFLNASALLINTVRNRSPPLDLHLVLNDDVTEGLDFDGTWNGKARWVTYGHSADSAVSLIWGCVFGDTAFRDIEIERSVCAKTGSAIVCPRPASINCVRCWFWFLFLIRFTRPVRVLLLAVLVHVSVSGLPGGERW